MLAAEPSAAPGTPALPTGGAVEAPRRAWGSDGFTFRDFLDIVNPLQHIPVVSWAYRAVTHDEIAPGARLAGGALFGGPLGLILAAADTTVEGATGADTGSRVLAMLHPGPAGPAGPGAPSAPAVAVAAGPDPNGDGIPTLNSAQDSVLLAAFGASGDEAQPESAVARIANSASALSDGQAALLLAAVGLPGPASLPPPDAAPALAQDDELREAAAASDEIRRLFAAPW